MKKIRKFEIVTVTMFLFVSLFVLNAVYAQDRNLESNTNVKTDSVMIDSVVKTEVDKSESVKTVSETVDEIRTTASEVEDEVKDKVKEAIDRNIIEIRKQTDLPAYELQKSVDSDRLDLFEELGKELRNLDILNSTNLDTLSEKVETKVRSIETSLEERSGLEADFERETVEIRNSIAKFVETVDQKREVIAEREGDKIFKDTDGDGLSDYDEEFIYNTDPENSSTAGDGITDAEKISRGIDPVSGSQIEHADPREDTESYVTYSYRLESVSLKEENKNLAFEGVALPNSYVTLYIFSTPIVVTVKTDNNGNWNYELEQELENGEHQMYVATVNNTGKIIARSNPIAFTKTAEAASIGIVGIDVETSNAGDFFRDNFILVSLAILILVVILAVMFLGRRKDVKEIVTELKNEVDGPTDQNLK